MIVIPAFVAALFKREDWEAVGYMDYSWTRTTKKQFHLDESDLINGRAVFFVSNKGNRRFDWEHDKYLSQVKGFLQVAQMIAWTKGGPLPDDFVPFKGPERKPWKVPERIRGQFNKDN